MGEGAESVDDRSEFAGDVCQRLAHQNEVGVVGDVARSRAEVDDVAGGRGHFPERVDVGHHVVPEPPFVEVGPREIDVVEVSAEFGELLGADARGRSVDGHKAEFLLSLGEVQPKPSPRAELPLWPPPLGHFSRGITADKRVVVDEVWVGHCDPHGERGDET